MQYIDTLAPLEQFFLVEEYATPEVYFQKTGKIAPEFNPNKPIKLWAFTPETTGPRQIMFDTVAMGEDGAWMYDTEGKYVTELILMLKTEAPQVNIPPKDFNFTANPFIQKANRPLQSGFVEKYDIVKSPDGFSIVARDKAKYAQFLEEKTAAVGGNPAFEATVLSFLSAISKKLGV
jgi:hypothetical protein